MYCSNWLSALLMLNQSKSFQTKLPTKIKEVYICREKDLSSIGMIYRV
nr:MAG TPA: hypothetical protein [Siphoviridae sp. ctzrC10]